jgi:transposase InsO family protein
MKLVHHDRSGIDRRLIRATGPTDDRQGLHWFNHVRLLTPIGGIPPAEAEANYWRQLAVSDTSAEVST